MEAEKDYPKKEDTWDKVKDYFEKHYTTWVWLQELIDAIYYEFKEDKEFKTGREFINAHISDLIEFDDKMRIKYNPNWVDEKVSLKGDAWSEIDRGR